METKTAVPTSETLQAVLHDVQERLKQNGRGAGGRELSLTATKLEEAAMWFQAALKELAKDL